MQKQTKNIINKLSTDELISVIEHKKELTKDNFNATIKQIKEKNKKETGAKPMTTENAEKTNNNPDIRDTEEFKTFIHENPHIRTEDQIEAYKLQKENPETFNVRFAPENKNNQETENTASTSPSNEEDKIEEEQKLDTKKPKSALITDIPIPSPTQEEPENTSWDTAVIKKYQEKYNTKDKENVTHEPLAEGVHIEVAPHSKGKQQLTGTAVNYHTKDHIEIQKTQNGVEPKDQSYQHFLDHMEILKKREFEEIELGKTSSPEFRTKLIAAALANDLKISTPLKENTISLSDETLKEIPENDQNKLLKFALENNVKLEFGENSPLLDFNNEAVQKLPDKLKCKYLAMLLANDKTKDKIKNAPQSMVREIKIDELKSKVIGKNDDGSDITVEDAHNKVKELRGRIKNGENRQEVLKEVKAETHGNNYFQYAQKHTQQKR